MIEDYLLATVTITKVMTDDDVVVCFDTVDADGDELAVIDAVGMLELAKHALLTPPDLWDDLAADDTTGSTD